MTHSTRVAAVVVVCAVISVLTTGCSSSPSKSVDESSSSASDAPTRATEPAETEAAVTEPAAETAVATTPISGATVDESVSPATTEQGVPTSVVSFGPGTVDVLDPTIGLDSLPSYHAVLTLEFSGTRAGTPETWRLVRDLVVSHEPRIRILTTTQTGTAPSSRQRIEIGRSRYDRSQDIRSDSEPCATSIIDPDGPEAGAFADDADPAAWLPVVRGSDDAGPDTVEGIPAAHATFDQRALGSLDPATSVGEIWTAVDGGEVLRLHVESVGASAFLGHETTGTLTLDYVLAEIGAPVTAEVPADCVIGVIDAPLPDGAQDVTERPGLVRFATSLAPADVIAFYEQQLAAAGWVIDGEPMSSETGVVRTFLRGDETFAVVARTREGQTRVTLTQDREPADSAG